MTDQDVSAGLVLPYAAVALLGKGGAGASFLLVFMAVTSAMSAELIAVSSIITYDIYQTYFNPEASGRFLIRMSHVSCVVYAIIMAGFSTGLYYAGISMGESSPKPVPGPPEHGCVYSETVSRLCQTSGLPDTGLEY